MVNDHSSRAHAKLSASGSHRWLACPYSATVADKYPQQDTPFTREGTIAHEVAEATVRGSSIPPDLPGCDAEMIRHAEAYRDYIQSLTTDESYVLLEQRVDFSLWVPDGFGTADCLVITGKTMDVVDYKYGQGVPVSAVENPQMKLYGLGAVNEYGFIYDIETVRMHIFQPRLDNISVFELSMEELLKWGKEVLKPGAEKAAAGLMEMHSGEHCRFCPHAGRCPELASYCQSMPIGTAPDSLTPAEIAALLQQEPVISIWLKKVKELALSQAMNGDTIPGYKVVEGRAGNRKWVDELKVAEALRAAGVAQEDFTTLKLLSPAEMEKSLGKKRANELLCSLIERSSGAPTLVPESDKRPAYDRKAEVINDF